MNQAIVDFHDHLMEDIFYHIKNVQSKKMFGGYGIYKDGNIFAIITSDSEIYFKVDEKLKEVFKKHDSQPFIYTGHKNKKPTEMPYWLLPEEIMIDKDRFAEWVDASVEVSKKGKR